MSAWVWKALASQSKNQIKYFTEISKVPLSQIDLRLESPDLTGGRQSDWYKKEIEELKQHIKEHGQLMPCLGYEEVGSGKVVLVAGFCRFQVMKELGLPTIKVKLADCHDDATAKLIAKLSECVTESKPILPESEPE